MMAPPFVDDVLGQLKRAVRPGGRTFHRDLLRVAQDSSEHGHLEEARLCQEVRHPVLVVEHMGDNQGIDFGAMVGRGNEAPGRELLESLPLLVHQEVHGRPDDCGHDEKSDVALGRFLHVALLTWPQ